jgi:hypothetical protein
MSPTHGQATWDTSILALHVKIETGTCYMTHGINAFFCDPRTRMPIPEHFEGSHKNKVQKPKTNKQASHDDSQQKFH